mgnify:CR=1 FL=1|jgi:hypothetical protein
MVNFYIPASSSVTINGLTGDEGIRRILCYSSGASSSNLWYKGITIGTFNNNNCIDIDFKSYYGFPKLSDFSIEASPNVTIAILADIVPYSVSADDYIETREVT